MLSATIVMNKPEVGPGHRGFGEVTFSSPSDLDALIHNAIPTVDKKNGKRQLSVVHGGKMLIFERKVLNDRQKAQEDTLARLEQGTSRRISVLPNHSSAMRVKLGASAEFTFHLKVSPPPRPSCFRLACDALDTFPSTRYDHRCVRRSFAEWRY